MDADAHTPAGPSQRRIVIERDGDATDVILGSREQLLHLLAEAAEIEHCLMCSYLYAAFSLKRAHEGLSPDEGDAVEAWRKTILSVAIEEMGHLILVANLTVAIGGRPHFARPNFPVSAGYFPSSVLVRLSPFSAETIDHFIFLERPRGVEGVDGETFEQDDYSRDQAHLGLMPGGQDYETIGELYDAIQANICALSRTLGENRLFLGPRASQVSGDLLKMDGVRVVSDLQSANDVIAMIVEQGEGAPAEREISHYSAFLNIRSELQALTQKNPAFAPAWPAAENPVLRRPLDGDHIWVEAPEAAVLLDFACAAYGLLLRLLVQLFGRTQADKVDQQALLDGSFDLMHTLAEASELLTRMPASPRSSPHAGMSFTMLRGVEPFAAGASEGILLREQLFALSEAAARLNLKCAPPLQTLARTFSLSTDGK